MSRGTSPSLRARFSHTYAGNCPECRQPITVTHGRNVCPNCDTILDVLSGPAHPSANTTPVTPTDPKEPA